MPTVRKRFGQHFLVDGEVLARIVRSIGPRPGERIVEIGPGPGALTVPLAQSGAELTAVEIDRDLAESLRERFAAAANVRIVTADVLTIDLAESGNSLRVVGNLPYNISTPFLFRLTEIASQVRDAHFMLQKEVVDRMAATPGSRTYGRLSVMLQSRWDVEPLFDVGPQCFRPPPKVESAVVRLTPRAEPLAIGDPDAFARLVAAAFGQRRKTLRNALRNLAAEADIRAAGIDPSARAETLSVPQFVQLSRVLSAIG